MIDRPKCSRGDISAFAEIIMDYELWMLDGFEILGLEFFWNLEFVFWNFVCA